MSLSDMTDPERVHQQYATEDNLETRRSVWQPTADGLDPVTESLRAIDRALVGDAHVLAGGGGPGVGAENTAALPGDTRVAIHFAERCVELTAARGVDARQADICYLPFDDASFDVVYAGWMLYHVRDLERALNEVRRVLKPGGTFVATTNGNDHVADLRIAAGGKPCITQFSSETGTSVLGRKFGDVRRHDLETRAVFPDHAAAQAYLDSSDEGMVLPHFDGEREYAGHVTVFEAR